MKIFIIVLALVASVGCGGIFDRDEPLVIKNSCRGSWLIVVDGDGRVLTERLDEGGIVSVEIEGYRGSTVHLIASGYEVGTNRDLGTAKTTRTVPRSSSSINGPSTQVEPWVIQHLTSSAADGDCRR